MCLINSKIIETENKSINVDFTLNGYLFISNIDNYQLIVYNIQKIKK